MNFIVFIIILFAAFLFGSIGFPQIIGTIKTWGNDPLFVNTIRIGIWAILLFLGYLLVSKVIGSTYNNAVYIGYGITFVLSIFSKPQ